LTDSILGNRYPASLFTSVASDPESRDVTGVFSRLRSRVPIQPCYLRARLVHGGHTLLADEKCDDRALRKLHNHSSTPVNRMLAHNRCWPHCLLDSLRAQFDLLVGFYTQDCAIGSPPSRSRLRSAAQTTCSTASAS